MADKGKLNGWIWRGVCALLGVAFGAGATYGFVINRLDNLTATCADHEVRIRTVEGAFGRIETKLDYLIEESKEERRTLHILSRYWSARYSTGLRATSATSSPPTG